MFNATFELDGLQQILAKRGLQDMGPVQQFVDSEVIRYCDPKVPFRTGVLKDSALTASIIGSGIIVYATPYARYLYYGEVMGPNIPIRDKASGTITGFWSPPGRPKHLTGRKLTYNGEPERGAFWFERMKAEHGADIIKGAAAMAGGEAE